jgi:type IV pilus assembly protein PilB
MSGQDLVLKNFLVETGLLSRSQIDAAMQQGDSKSFSQAIVESGIISEDELRRASARALGIPFVTLSKNDIAITALVLIPEPLSRTANIIAYSHGDDGVEIALLDLADLPQIDFLRTSHRVQVRLTDRASMKQALLLYQKHLKEKFAGMVQGGKEAAESLLKHALHSGAHYVHVEPAAAEAAGMIVRYRLEGALREAMRLPEEASTYIVERLKSLAKLFPVTTAVQEGAFTFAHEGEEVGVSVTTVPTAYGEKLTMRLARQKSGVAGFSLQSLGLHGTGLELVHDALQTQQGLVLVAGMSGSGKTTLLYTMLDHVTGAHKAIATVEEHIEHRLPQVHQTVTRPDLGLTVPAALRAVLKQDPDAVMVSDIAVGDSAEIALRAAKRGVFMLGGLRARSASGALDILLSEGSVDPLLLNTTVSLVVAQRVLRRPCVHAKSRLLTRAEAELLENKVRFAKVLAALKQEHVVHEYTAWKDVSVHMAQPCKDCEGVSESGAKTGYNGLAGIQEVLPVATADGTEGMLTLLEDALFKAVQGQTSIEEVVEMASE